MCIRDSILTKQQELARTTAEDESGIKFLCTTVHKAKGLEYGTVILPFTGQAIDNLQKANTDVNYSSPKLAYSIKVDENKKDDVVCRHDRISDNGDFYKWSRSAESGSEN